MLKKIMPIKTKKQCGYGWDIVFPKTSKYKFSMTTNKCIFAQMFEKYGMKEMTKGFCLVDNLMYSELPHTKFSYSQRIGDVVFFAIIHSKEKIKLVGFNCAINK